MRLVTQQRLRNNVESAKRAYRDAYAVAKVLERYATLATMAERFAIEDLDKARKKFEAHKTKMNVATAKEREKK